jgi:hypothetical protein
MSKPSPSGRGQGDGETSAEESLWRLLFAPHPNPLPVGEGAYYGSCRAMTRLVSPDTTSVARPYATTAPSPDESEKRK